MDISSIYGYGYNPAVSLINALYPARSVSPLGSLGSLLPLTGVQTSISGAGSLLNGVEKLQSSAQALIDAGKFDARSVSSLNAKIATGAAAAGTANGSYAVEVRQLAQAQTLTTAAQTGPLTSLGSGAATLRFQFASGETKQVALSANDNTLSGIASAINSADIGIEAKVVSSNGAYQLTLTGQTGAPNAFTISATGNSSVASLLSYTPGSTGGPALTTQAQNAEGLVNGNAFVSSTNKVNSPVAGLTLNLAGTGKTALTVAPDNALATPVGNFVAAYNSVQSGLTRLGADNSTLGMSAAYLRGQLASSVGAGSELAQIGITANAGGTLNFSAQTFTAALGKSSNAVAAILGGNGLAQRIVNLSEGTLSPSNLLQLAIPSGYYPGLTGSGAMNGTAAYLGQLGVMDKSSYTTGLSSQWLLYELSHTSQSNLTGASSSGTQFLQSLLAQQTFNASLLGSPR